MANHAGELVVLDLINTLWHEFKRRTWTTFEKQRISTGNDIGDKKLKYSTPKRL